MEAFVEHFGIEGKLLLAQAVNFLVLLFILKRYAYGPLLNMMKTRKNEIEKGIRFKEESEQELTRIGELKEQTLHKAREDAVGIVKSGEEHAEARKAEILDEASKKREALFADAQRRIREEEAKMAESVAKNAGEFVRLAVGKILGKMPESERDNALIEEALREARKALQKS